MVLVMGAARKALEPSAAAAAATVSPCCFASEPVVVLPPTNYAVAAASIFVLLLGTGPWSPDSFVSNASASEPGLPLLAAISGGQPRRPPPLLTARAAVGWIRTGVSVAGSPLLFRL